MRGDPIFPWPTNIERRELLAEDLQGEWIAYTTDEVYFLDIQVPADSPYRISFTVRSGSEIGKTEIRREGLAYWGRHVFWGHVSMDGEHYTQMVIFREQGILKMRIELPHQQGYFDVELQRAPWNIK
jgi:hypothetical protein